MLEFSVAWDKYIIKGELLEMLEYFLEKLVNFRNRPISLISLTLTIRESMRAYTIKNVIFCLICTYIQHNSLTQH